MIEIDYIIPKPIIDLFNTFVINLQVRNISHSIVAEVNLTTRIFHFNEYLIWIDMQTFIVIIIDAHRSTMYPRSMVCQFLFIPTLPFILVFPRYLLVIYKVSQKVCAVYAFS